MIPSVVQTPHVMCASQCYCYTAITYSSITATSKRTRAMADKTESSANAHGSHSQTHDINKAKKTKSLKVEEYNKGDKVRIRQEASVINHRVGWKEEMQKTLGKVGQVVNLDSDGDLLVSFGRHHFLFAPAACTRVTSGVRVDLLIMSTPKSRSPTEKADETLNGAMENDSVEGNTGNPQLQDSYSTPIKASVTESSTNAGGSHSQTYDLNKVKKTKSSKVEEYKKGDKVRIRQEASVLNHRVGWKEEMQKIVGKVGQVVNLDSDGDLLVSFGRHHFLFAPAACTRVTSGVRVDLLIMSTPKSRSPTEKADETLNEARENDSVEGNTGNPQLQDSDSTPLRASVTESLNTNTAVTSTGNPEREESSARALNASRDVEAPVDLQAAIIGDEQQKLALVITILDEMTGQGYYMPDFTPTQGTTSLLLTVVFEDGRELSYLCRIYGGTRFMGFRHDGEATQDTLEDLACTIKGTARHLYDALDHPEKNVPLLLLQNAIKFNIIRQSPMSPMAGYVMERAIQKMKKHQRLAS